jgi:hypothetical protein
MKYLLDFDGVIFDAKALKKRMALLGIDEETRSGQTLDEIVRRDGHFDVTSLLYPDAKDFLEQHASDCEIISSYVSFNHTEGALDKEHEEFQKSKIMRSGVLALLGESRIHVVGLSKKDMLLALKQKFSQAEETCVFIDDRKEYTEEASELNIRAFLMCREKAQSGFEAVNVIHHPQEISSFNDIESRL